MPGKDAYRKWVRGMTFGIVIPVGEWRGTLPQVLDALYAFAGDARHRYRVIPVENGGGADSQEAVRALVAERTGVTGILLSHNTGQQHALYVGMQHLPPACDRVVTMDDYGAHPVSLLADMLAQLDGGAGFCFGTPERRKGSLLRKDGTVLRDILFSLC